MPTQEGQLDFDGLFVTAREGCEYPRGARGPRLRRDRDARQHLAGRRHAERCEPNSASGKPVTNAALIAPDGRRRVERDSGVHGDRSWQSVEDLGAVASGDRGDVVRRRDVRRRDRRLRGYDAGRLDQPLEAARREQEEQSCAGRAGAQPMLDPARRDQVGPGRPFDRLAADLDGGFAFEDPKRGAKISTSV
jgi:hypothetical protein